MNTNRLEFDWKIKNNKTGEILTVVSKGYSTGEVEEEEWVVVGKSGERVRVKKSIIGGEDKEFSILIADFTKLGLEKSILEACSYSKTTRDLITAFAKRLHPGGYFHVGDVVFVKDPSALLCINPSSYYRYRDLEDGMKLIITEIKQVYGDPDCMGESTSSWAILDPIPKFIIKTKRFEDKDIEVKESFMNFEFTESEIRPGDAFYTLERYDTPY